MESEQENKEKEVEKKAKKTGGELGVFFVNILVIFLIAAISSFGAVSFYDRMGFGFNHEDQAGRGMKAVIIDTEALMREQALSVTEKFKRGEISHLDIAPRGKEMFDEIARISRMYADDGIIVLKAQSVFVVPNDVEDITDLVRTKLIETGKLFEVEKNEEKNK